MEKAPHARNYDQVDHDREQMLAQLNGLTRLLSMPISDEAKATVNAQIGRHRNRLALMDTLVQAYDALEADGYPEMMVEPSATVQEEIHELLQAQREQVKAQAEVVSDELSVVQEVFGGRARRSRLAAEHASPPVRESTATTEDKEKDKK